MRRTAIVCLAVAMVLGACGGDDDDVGPPPDDPRETPESLTEALMLLWQARDRASADRLGDDRAIDSLFEVTPPTEAVEVADCVDEPQLPGARTCRARGGGQTVLVTVRRDDAGTWRAVAVLPVR